jgi:hypothetical protein
LANIIKVAAAAKATAAIERAACMADFSLL